MNKLSKFSTLLALTIGFSMNAQMSDNSFNDNNATAPGSVAMGGSTTATGFFSTAMGRNTTASGDFSTAMGYRTTATDYGSLVIGQFNLSGSITTNPYEFSLENTAFVIGNGLGSPEDLSDAFKVMFNGDATVGRDLTIGGDHLTIGDLSVFSGTFTNRSAIDVVADSEGGLMTGYLSGAGGDRFNIELDSSNELAKISSGGGYDLTFSTEGGTINFESNSFDNPGTYAFEGNTTVSNDLTVSGDTHI
jgi:hypothetical protein